MPFEYSSFISWAHVDGEAESELGNTFVESLYRALSQEIALRVRAPMYIDRRRLIAGYKFEPALASAMCHSATWVLVFTPVYLDQDFCLREMAAMEQLEQRRRAVLGDHLPREHGLIIPIILRGEDKEIPDHLRTARHYLDFRGFTLVDPDISRNPEYVTDLGRVASYIAKLARLDVDGAHDCGTYELPQPTHETSHRQQAFPGRQRSV